MNLHLRYFALGLVAIISLHFLASNTLSSYSTATHASLDYVRGSLAYQQVPSLSSNSKHEPGHTSSSRPNAAFVVLCQDKDLSHILMSLQTLESTFNSKPENRYPYVFLNDGEFSERFKRRVQAITSGPVEFGLVPQDMWAMPDTINATRASIAWSRSGNMPYGHSKSYRQMCRFQSGFFWRHPLVLKYKYYWRVEPKVQFLCDMRDFDPFRFMRDTGKKYGFTIALHEIPATVRTLWISVRKWYEANPHFLHPNNAMPFVSKNGGKAYNMCHFWSNFEIADLDFFRSEAYLSFFNHLDAAGGFFYERWGDAPVHSIAASLLLDKNEIHHFDNVGYVHPPFMHCPKEASSDTSRCYCTHETSLDYDDNHWSCLYDWDEINGRNSTQKRIEWLKLES